MISLVAKSANLAALGMEAVLRYRAKQSLVVKTKLNARKPASSYCQPQITTTWFPVAPGVSVPVSAPAPTTNEDPKPANSVTVPEGFDVESPDLCYLFQDLLPVNTPPVFPVEQDADFLTQPYNEITKAVARIRSFLNVQALNYPLNLETRIISLRLRPALQLISYQLLANASSFNLVGKSADFYYDRTLVSSSGKFVLGRPAGYFRRNYVLNTVTYDFLITGAANLIWSQILDAEMASASVTGQNINLTKFNLNEFYLPVRNLSIASALPVLDTRAELEIPFTELKLSNPIPIVPPAPPVLQATGNINYGTDIIALGWPPHLVGDIGLIVFESSGDGSTATPPSGWQAVPGSPSVDIASSAGSKLQAWWKRATSSSENGVLIPDTGDHQVGRIYTFRGANATGNPWDVFAVASKTTASNVATVPSITTVSHNNLVVMLISRPEAGNVGSHFSNPVNPNLQLLTEHTESSNTAGNGGGFTVVTGVKQYPGETGATTLNKATATTDAYIVLTLVSTALSPVSLSAPAVNINFAAKPPGVIVGAASIVPATNLNINPLVPLLVGPPAKIVPVPVSQINFSSLLVATAIGVSLDTPVADISILKSSPTISIGSTVFAPQGLITLTALLPQSIGQILELLIPTKNLEISGLASGISSGASIECPPGTGVLIEMSVPAVGSESPFFASWAEQNYSWNAEFYPDWWAD